jgi:hypothetical protein
MPLKPREWVLKRFKFTKIILTQMAYKYFHFNFYKQTKYAGYGKTEGLNGNFHTPKAVGRPRTRWADVVRRDALQLLGIRGWKGRTEGRDEWRRLVRETKVMKGL